MRVYSIQQLIALLISAATALKGDGIDLVVDPSADTAHVPQRVALAYGVSTALGEWYGDGQGEWAGGGQSTLPPPTNSDGTVRDGWNGFEDSHGPWQQNLFTWVRLQELDKTLETLKNAPRFEGMGMDEIRNLITNDPEEAAYAYVYTINIKRFADKVIRNPITEDMDAEEALNTLDNIYTDWWSTQDARGNSYENALNISLETVGIDPPLQPVQPPTTIVEPPTVPPPNTQFPRPPEQEPYLGHDEKNKFLEEREREIRRRWSEGMSNREILSSKGIAATQSRDGNSKREMKEILLAMVNKRRNEKGMNTYSLPTEDKSGRDADYYNVPTEDKSGRDSRYYGTFGAITPPFGKAVVNIEEVLDILEP